jgi:hypothetical protein
MTTHVAETVRALLKRAEILRTMADRPRPLTTDYPAGDNAADQAWDAESALLRASAEQAENQAYLLCE